MRFHLVSSSGEFHINFDRIQSLLHHFSGSSNPIANSSARRQYQQITGSPRLPTRRKTQSPTRATARGLKPTDPSGRWRPKRMCLATPFSSFAHAVTSLPPSGFSCACGRRPLASGSSPPLPSPSPDLRSLSWRIQSPYHHVLTTGYLFMSSHCLDLIFLPTTKYI